MISFQSLWDDTDSLLHVIGGSIAFLTGSPEAAWFVLGMLYLSLAAWTGMRWGRLLLPDSSLPAIAGMLFVLFAGTSGMVPAFAGMAGLLALAAVSMAVEDSERWFPRALVTGGLLGAAIAVRLFTGGIGLVCFLIWLALEKQRPASWRIRFGAVVTGTAILFAAPWLFNLASMQTDTVAQLTGTESGMAALGAYLNDLARAVKTRMLAVPYDGLKTVFGILQLSALFALFSSRLYPGDQARALLRWGIIVLVFFLLPWRWLLFGSGLEPSLAGRMIPIVGRVHLLFPMAMNFAVLFGGIAVLEKRLQILPKTLYRRAARFTVFGLTSVLLVLICFPGAVRIRLMLGYGHNVHPRFERLYAGKPTPVFQSLNGKTILSDAWTSYMLQYPLGIRCVTVPIGHSSGRVDVLARSARLRDFFAGYMNSEEASEFINNMAGDYVLINRRLADGRGMPYFDAPVLEYDDIDWAYLHDFSLLSRIYEDDDLLLFAVNREPAVGN